MFIEEEEWSDDQEAEVLSRTVLKNEQKNVKSCTNAKPKVVGRKSLMRTLQTLGSVPDWKSEERQQDSDSETEAAPSSSKKKKKKKRRNRRKHTDATEEPENEETDQTLIDEKTSTKQNQREKKIGNQKVKNNSVGETEVKGKDKPVIANVNKPEDAEKLNRKQWKNKMKNKRKSKNKYRPDKMPEEDVKKAESVEENKPNKEVKTDSQNNNNNKSEKNRETSAKKKEKKRKQTEEDANVTCETQTRGETKEVKAVKCDTGLKREADELKEEFAEEPQTPTKRPKLELSKEQSLKRERLRKILQPKQTEHKQEDEESPAVEKEEPPTPEPEPEVKLDRSTSLRLRMQQRLESARFRYINEVLYSTTSGEARRMFGQDPEAFGIYHRGYTAQVQRWPSNPVDTIIAYIKQKPSSLVLADFGCGDCKIARSVKNKVHSFDLAATCELVTVCDMANVPLRDRSVDVAVFCLSLMGTNLTDFLAEANRVLKMGGVLKIAEVASRFENVRNFITGLANLGFKLTNKDTENTHFFSFEFVKTGDAPENIKKFGLQLMPCVYKKR